MGLFCGMAISAGRGLEYGNQAPVQAGIERVRWHSMSEQFAVQGLVPRDVALDFAHIDDKQLAMVR